MPADLGSDPIRLLAGDSPVLRHATRIAGCDVSSAFAFDGFDAQAPTPTPRMDWPAFDGPGRQTTGFIVERTRAIRSVSHGACLRMTFEDLGELRVDLDAGIAMADADLPPAALREVLLGPGLLLPLAARGVWALHASAVHIDGRVFLLAGPSGSGKSSLARAAAERDGLLADDVSPVSVGTGIRLRPRFPQLKWDVPLAVPDLDLDIAGIVFVERGADALALDPVDPADARLRLIRDTVAARLFPPVLLARHLDAVTRIATALPMLALGWPQTTPVDVVAQCRRALELLAQSR